MPDLKNHAVQQQAMMEAFFFAYQAFTTKPDEMLARRGLGRVHHRVLFFIARYPGLSVKELLALLGVTKQALNIPLRQLLEMNLIGSATADDDKRKRLGLTAEGVRLKGAASRAVAAAPTLLRGSRRRSGLRLAGGQSHPGSGACRQPRRSGDGGRRLTPMGLAPGRSASRPAAR